MSNGSTAGFESLFEDAPFSFQKEVGDALLAGTSIILRAPTGAGKTRTALFPFLHAWQTGAAFPRQMIYSLPLRTLANSLYAETLFVCERAFPDQAHRPIVTIQTGEQPGDPQFLTGDIIFTTYDQSLSSFLSIPIGLSHREGNVNAGAIISSYLVFDEFHLMEAGQSLATMATMLGYLKSTTPFLLMTATLSEALAERLADIVGAKVITVKEKDLSLIPSQQDKQRVFHVVEQTLMAAAIVEAHQQRSIAVCNTVDRAQELFEQVKTVCLQKSIPADVILLHSRFLPHDRKRIEGNIREWFGKKPEQRREAILIATQAIEVGLDLTCENLHTEVAPAAAVIQRAGRCARFPGEAGAVFIYDVPEDENGERMYLPYDSKGQTPFCPQTWEALKTIDGQTVGFRQEQALIETVYGEADREALTENFLKTRRSEIAGVDGVWTTQDRDVYRDLVRYVDSRAFFVHDAPETVEAPHRLVTFSVSPGTLVRWWKEFDDSKFDDWFAQVVTEKGDQEKAERYLPPLYKYEIVLNPQRFYNAFFFVINPQFVDYTPDIGLRFRRNGTPPEALSKPARDRSQFSGFYELETYEEHIQRVWEAYLLQFGDKGRFDYIASRLRASGKTAWDALIRATIAAHDIGN